MKMTTMLTYGMKHASRQWQAAAAVYALQLGLALAVGMQVHEVLDASVGQSMEISKLLQHYDHTVVADFLKVHGSSISTWLGQLRWFLLLWLFFSVFLNAGLLHVAVKTEGSAWQSFWSGGARYFAPFLKITLFFLLLMICWTAITLGPALAFLPTSLEYFRTEQYSVWMFTGAMGLWALGMAVLFLWSVASRLQYISGAPIVRSIRQGARLLRAQKKRVTVLFLSFLALQLLLIAGYWLLAGTIRMAAPATILIVFLLQQLFVFGRVWLRLAVYAAMGRF